MPRLTASVVIPTRNRRATLEALLARIAPQAATAGAEVVVVDNGSTDGTREALAGLEAEGRLRVVIESEPGLSRARNAGGRAALGAVAASIDHAAPPPDGWLPPLVA